MSAGFGTVRDLNRDLALIEDATKDADIVVAEALPLTDLDNAALLYDRLVQVCRDLSRIRDAWGNLIGESMPTGKMLLGGRMRMRYYNKSRRNWDSEALLRTVLDTRVVNEETGEIEATLDVIRKVWGLAGYQARTGALKALGIDPSEFCETEVRGYRIGDAR